MTENKMKTRLVVTLLLTSLSLLGNSRGALRAESKFDDELNQLLSEDPHERKVAAELLAKAQDNLVIDLLEIANTSRPLATSDDMSTWRLAVDMLGNLRARSAVSYLVSEITTQVPTLILGGSLLASFPSARALVNIGMPSVDDLIIRCGEPASKKEKVVIALTLYQILGEEGALRELNAAMHKPYPTNKLELSRTLEILSTRDFNYEFAGHTGSRDNEE